MSPYIGLQSATLMTPQLDVSCFASTRGMLGRLQRATARKCPRGNEKSVFAHTHLSRAGKPPVAWALQFFRVLPVHQKTVPRANCQSNHCHMQSWLSEGQ